MELTDASPLDVVARTTRYAASVDAQKRQRYKTVALIVEEHKWQPPEVVAIRVGIEETALRQQVVRLGSRDRSGAEKVIGG